MTPSSVYRLQFTPNFTFRDAIKILPYLKKLGIEAIYASPLFEARYGSTHGYDNTSPHSIRQQFGGWDGFEAFTIELKEYKMGLILDVVANHMAASEENAWWVDVLKNGSSSKYAPYFDIDWCSSRSDLKGKVYLPILEGPLIQEIEKGKVRVSDDGKNIEAGWQTLPIAEGSLEESPKVYNLSPKMLKHLLDSQFYRLAFWESGPEHVNYRRFFDINDLAALRVEEKEVFDDVHGTIFSLIKEGRVQGLRIDHPDGFLDPKTYFERLQEGGAKFIIVEKILERGEKLRDDWGVDGTVGYEVLCALSGLFVDSRAEMRFTDIYHSFLGKVIDEKKMLFLQKRNFALLYMPSELKSLTRKLQSFASFPFDELYEALADLLAAFPVYRTYITDHVSKEDERYIEEAFGTLETYGKHINPQIIPFLKRWLLMQEGAEELIWRFQQLTSPIMAKGKEDTHLYVYNRFIALNEVGGDPHEFGTALKVFHDLVKDHSGFVTTSTHDTKRSLDVRMRLSALSELGDEWEEQVFKWRKLVPQIEPNVLYFFFQTLLGFWDLNGDMVMQEQRLCDYFIKAQREGKEHTNWLNHNENFEHGLTSFAREVVKDKRFLTAFAPFLDKVASLGRKNTYSALTLKLGLPGTVDIYQGSEHWDLSLVDPDNRRLVDYDTRLEVLDEIKHIRDFSEWQKNGNDSRLKQFLIWKGLHVRKTYPDLFVSGEYIPLKVTGDKATCVVAYMRRDGKKVAVIFALRFYSKHSKGFGNTKIVLPKSYALENIFTDERFSSKELLLNDLTKILPVGILC